jgi:hypothetical protein
MVNTSVRDIVLKVFLSQQSEAKPLEEPNDEMDLGLGDFPPVILKNFMSLNMRWYEGFQGIRPEDGTRVPVPGSYRLVVKSDKGFHDFLNGLSKSTENITYEGPRLDPAAEKTLVVEAERCRSELLKNNQAQFAGVCDLRIQNRTKPGTKIVLKRLTDFMSDSRDCPPENNRSALSQSFEELLNK